MTRAPTPCARRSAISGAPMSMKTCRRKFTTRCCSRIPSAPSSTPISATASRSAKSDAELRALANWRGSSVRRRSSSSGADLELAPIMPSMRSPRHGRATAPPGHASSRLVRMCTICIAMRTSPCTGSVPGWHGFCNQLVTMTCPAWRHERLLAFCCCSAPGCCGCCRRQRPADPAAVAGSMAASWIASAATWRAPTCPTPASRTMICMAPISTGANATLMCMSFANFTGASFRGTELSGANLAGAKMDGADLTGAEHLDHLFPGHRPDPGEGPDPGAARRRLRRRQDQAAAGPARFTPAANFLWCLRLAT